MQDGELRAILRELDYSKRAHQKTLAEINEAIKVCADLGAAHPDALRALEHAERQRRESFERYRRALDVFNQHCREIASRKPAPIGD